MRHNGSNYAVVFSMETSFQRMARRPGGIPRQQALRNARTGVLRLFIRGFRAAAPLPLPPAPLRCPPPRVGYLAIVSGFKLD